jgi:hypothetical protein
MVFVYYKIRNFIMMYIMVKIQIQKASLFTSGCVAGK